MSIKELAEALPGSQNLKDWAIIMAIIFGVAVIKIEMVPGFDNIKKTLDQLTHGFLKLESKVENIQKKQSEHSNKLSRLESIPAEVENLKRVVYKTN